MNDELYIDFGTPGRQSRVTVAFRWLLALPHVVVLLVLTLVAIPLMVVGWFAALVLGRLPGWIANYMTSLIAYSVRVNAYQFMLAREFPPFSFSVAADYPVKVEIEASPLSRPKVFFRLLLAIPAAIVTNIVTNGLGVFGVIVWLVTLVLGRMPQPMFSAVAAVIRYQSRYYAYASLVTDAYPRRLFGDRDADWAPEGLRLPLRGAANWLMGLIVAIGIPLFILSFVLPYELRSHEDPALVAAENRLENKSRTSIAALQICQTAGCLQTHERYWSTAFDGFASSLSRVSFPASKQQEVSALARDAGAIGQALRAASNSSVLDENLKLFQKAQKLLGPFETDAKALLGHGL